MANKNYIQRADSKQSILGYMPNAYFETVTPNFSFSGVIEMVDKDPAARGALNRFVDRCMSGDFAVVKRDSKAYDEEFQQKLLRDYKFRTDVLRKIFLLGKMYNNVYIELVRRTDGSVKELNVLDSMKVGVITKPNGDLLKLIEKSPNPTTGNRAEWSENEIVWIKFNDRTQGYAPVDFRALWETLLLKDYVRQFVSWLWKTGQYKVHYNFNKSSEQDVLDFLAYLKKTEHDFRKPIITKGEGESKLLRDIKEIDSIDLLLKYLDNQIAIALGVPPNDLGMPDSSGRSNADAQTNNFDTTVTSFKTVVEDAISHDLFPKMNKGNNLLIFAPNDRFSEKQVFEVLQIMQSMNMTDEVMREYLYDRGMVYAAKKLFKDPMEGMVNTPANPRALDTMPSRTGKGTGEGNKPQASVSTREDQIKKV